MRIAICDDEKILAERLKAMIEDAVKSLDVLMDVYTDGNELLRRFEQKKYDLVFLDQRINPALHLLFFVIAEIDLGHLIDLVFKILVIVSHTVYLSLP